VLGYAQHGHVSLDGLNNGFGVPSSDTLSVAVSPAKQLFEAYLLWVAVMTPEARGH
jgi:hypothetical protein